MCRVDFVWCRESLRKRSSQLCALNAITAAITQNVGLSPSINTDFDAVTSPPLTPSESRLLEENDLEKYGLTCSHFVFLFCLFPA